MVGEISGVTKTELLRAIRNRYREASRKDKSRMLEPQLSPFAVLTMGSTPISEPADSPEL